MFDVKVKAAFFGCDNYEFAKHAAWEFASQGIDPIRETLVLSLDDEQESEVLRYITEFICRTADRAFKEKLDTEIVLLLYGEVHSIDFWLDIVEPHIKLICVRMNMSFDHTSFHVTPVKASDEMIMIERNELQGFSHQWFQAAPIYCSPNRTLN